jgi:hypothetical protein
VSGSAPPETAYEVVIHDVEDRTWVMLAVSGLRVDAKGHRFTSPLGDGTVSGHFTLNSTHPVLHFSADNTGPCTNCDTYPSFDYYDDAEQGARVVFRGQACTTADGVRWSTDLVVASGTMIVTDDLRPIYDVPLPGRGAPGYNSILGQRQHSEDLAAIGCAFGPANDMSLTMFRVPGKGPDAYAFVNCDSEAEPGEEGYFEGEPVASVCTDVWAYSVADFAHFVARARALVAAPDYPEPKRFDGWSLAQWLADGAAADSLPSDYACVSVTPGTYRFHHLSGIIKANADHVADETWPLVWGEVELLT